MAACLLYLVFPETVVDERLLDTGDSTFFWILLSA